MTPSGLISCLSLTEGLACTRCHADLIFGDEALMRAGYGKQNMCTATPAVQRKVVLGRRTTGANSRP